MWQDYVILVIQVSFALSLIPSVLSDDKPAILTSMFNAILLVVLAIVFASLSLWSSSVATFSVAVLWTVLMVQVLRRDHIE
jgi:uncharacterized membrane protein YagU involved in acid resistance